MSHMDKQDPRGTAATKTLHCAGTSIHEPHEYTVPADVYRRAIRCADCARWHASNRAYEWWKNKRAAGTPGPELWALWKSRQDKAKRLSETETETQPTGEV